MNEITPVKSVGVRTPLLDGPEKVSGKAMYTADFSAPEALVGRILRSPVAHARIVSVDTAKAEALAGVIAVATGQDCADTYGVLPISMNAKSSMTSCRPTSPPRRRAPRMRSSSTRSAPATSSARPNSRSATSMPDSKKRIWFANGRIN